MAKFFEEGFLYFIMLFLQCRFGKERGSMANSFNTYFFEIIKNYRCIGKHYHTQHDLGY